MDSKKKKMDELIGNNVKNAVNNVVCVVNRCLRKEVLSEKDWEKAEELSRKLGVVFYENGDIAL